MKPAKKTKRSRIELQFKRKPRYSEDLSNTYEAIVSPTVRVNIVKVGDPFYGWTFRFITNGRAKLTTSNSDLLSSLYNGMSKKQIVDWVTELVNDKEVVDGLNKEAKRR